MTARYGDRSRVSEQVKNWGKTAVAGTETLVFRAETFTAPGTWTWPGNTDEVDVFAVGGGGFAASGSQTHGGGGAVVSRFAGVSGPVPVTVGAGAVSGTTGDGGISLFGPVGPGPTANIPPSTVAAGGGGGTDADQFVGGGGGGGNSFGGFYGFPGPGGGSSSPGAQGHTGFDGYGGGARSDHGVDGSAQSNKAARPNSGGGGAGPHPGAAGIVIVRWFDRA